MIRMNLYLNACNNVQEMNAPRLNVASATMKHVHVSTQECLFFLTMQFRCVEDALNIDVLAQISKEHLIID